jgi:uncharacterized cupredoxin-like copper-binding protein
VNRAATAITLAGVIALTVAACSDSEPDHNVAVMLTDYEVDPDATTAEAGETTFEIDNDADQVHEFVVVKTDLAPDDLPLDEDGLVDERGDGLEFIDEVEDLEGGESAELTADLAAGTYLLLCNLPDHFQHAMYKTFTVTESGDS